MMKFKILFFLICGCYVSQAQKFDVYCSTSPYLSSEVTDFKIHLYSPVFIAKRTYQNLSEVVNQYPEELVQSEMSVTSQAWSSFNYGVNREAEPKRYDMIKKADVTKNYAHLLYKVSYISNGIQYAIVKLHIYSEIQKDPTGFALAMKKQGNKWIICDDAAITDLMFMMIFLKQDALKNIFENNNTQNFVLDGFIKTSSQNGALNLNQLLSSIKNQLTKDKISLETVLDPFRIFK